MIRLTATRNQNDITITASVELADGATDLPAKLRTLVDHVTAVTTKPPANGHAQPPAGQPGHAGPTNGNGEDHAEGISAKQRTFALALASRLAIKGVAGLSKKAEELLGKKLNDLSRREASQLIDYLREQSDKAAS